MLRIKTKIGPSKIHGIGIFADQFIPKGTLTWEYESSFDMSLTDTAVQGLQNIAKEYYLYYSYFDKNRNLYILPTDHLKFINHSSNLASLNIDSTPDRDIAARDINPGEELLCDYNKFDDTYFKRIGLDPDALN